MAPLRCLSTIPTHLGNELDELNVLDVWEGLVRFCSVACSCMTERSCFTLLVASQSQTAVLNPCSGAFCKFYSLLCEILLVPE